MRKIIKIKNKFLRFFRFFFKLTKKKYFNFFILHKVNNDLLSRLCRKYGTDKGFEDNTAANRNCHTYSGYYHHLFSHCRDNVKLVFECGIGTNNPKLLSSMGSKGKPGASLRVWKSYFPKATIYGADIDKKILFSEERIKTFYLNQLNSRSIKKAFNKIKKKNFDLIIDDGLHTFESGRIFFENSINFLSKTGIFIIEDVAYKDLIKYIQYFDQKKKYIVSYIGLTLNPKVAGDSTLINIRRLY